MARVGSDDAYVAVVLNEDSRHGGVKSRGVDPIDCVHLFDEGTLTNDSTDKVEGEGGRIIPVARHHFPDRDFFPSR